MKKGAVNSTNPLALRGAKSGFYQLATSRNVLVHDWLWRPHGNSFVVSALLLKRINLLAPAVQNDNAPIFFEPSNVLVASNSLPSHLDIAANSLPSATPKKCGERREFAKGLLQDDG